MRTCVIFNPVARGDKARRFRRHLDQFAAECALKQTASAGDARRLAADAVRDGFEVVVAAGGDGTLNEVLNGIGDVPDGFERARLGVLPLGTVNVFARELGVPTRLEDAWRNIREGRDTCIDLPRVEYAGNGARTRRYFAQLAGAGLDSRAIQLVQWSLKKKVGALAYVIAGFQALAGKQSTIIVGNSREAARGELILVGNGRLYGGRFRVFPKADLRDGQLEVRVFRRVNWMTLARCGPELLLASRLPATIAETFQLSTFTLSSETALPIQVDGELAGNLPATFSVDRLRLRVIAPGQAGV